MEHDLEDSASVSVDGMKQSAYEKWCVALWFNL